MALLRLLPTRVCWESFTITILFHIIGAVEVSSTPTTNVVTCGQIATSNRTCFQNPEYPQVYTTVSGTTEVCQLRIRRRNSICQLKLDFVVFEIDGPSTFIADPENETDGINDASNCKTDVLFVTSSGTTMSPLCGIMTGQHCKEFYSHSTPGIYPKMIIRKQTLTLQTRTGNIDRDRQWSIEMTTIPCASVTRAPTGCLQYFTGISGQVRSFNFLGAYHLANMDYTICIRVEEGMRFIEWSACNPGDVKIIGGTPGTFGTPPQCPLYNFNDYLTIVGGIQYPHVTSVSNQTFSSAVSTTDRFCDASFATAANFVRSSVRPFMLYFKTDSMEMPPAESVIEGTQGFCLKWRQHP